MRRSLGRAMTEAIAGERSEEPEERGKPAMASSRRRDIFRHLCLRPCASLAELSETSGLAPATLQWHLARLLQAGYVSHTVRDAFYPRDLVASDDVPFFEELSKRSSRKLFVAILERAGHPVADLARSANVSRQLASIAIVSLERLGMVAIVRDGRYRRAYPTTRLAARQEAQRARSRRYADILVSRLKAEGLAPEVARGTDSEIILRVGPGARKASFEVSLDPFATSLGKTSDETRRPYHVTR